MTLETLFDSDLAEYEYQKENEENEKKEGTK